MGVFRNLLGTSETLFRIGLAGPSWKREGAAEVSARNTADSAYAAVRALLFKTFGNDIELNSGAAGSGADWRFTLRRPATGMTAEVVVQMPASSTPTVGQALTVTNIAAGPPIVITLGYATVPTGNDQLRLDTTSIAFGTASPVAMFNLPAGAVMRMVSVTIDTPFNGTPSLAVGITGTTSKYMPATAVDLTAPAGTVFEYVPGVAAPGGIEAIIATYAAGGASAGAARIESEWVIPS
jgi:hypothetical protein